MAKFTTESGGKGNRKGSKDHSWAKISFWMDRINAEWDKLTPNQKTHYSVELTKLLVSKLKVLPGSASDSVSNAQDSMRLLKEIEAPVSPIAIPDPKASDQV
jgi:hypothetical protein